MKGFEEYFYAGIPTFMGSSYIDLDEVQDYDVAVIGVPVDFGASYRQGAKYAPRSIREYSAWDSVEGLVFYDLDSNKEMHSNNLKICDLGDINVSPTNPNQNNKDIIEIVSKIRHTTFPIILGGDHSITYSSFIGCLNGTSKKNKPKIGILHFDAHPDVEQNYLSMPEIWHGNSFRKLIENGFLEGSNMVMIGQRGIINKEWYDFIKDNKINLFTSKEVNKKGIEYIMQQAISNLGNNCDAVYVTVDIDCLDISEAQGTGTPKCGGLKGEDLIIAMRMLNKIKTVGFDLVELNPKYDQSGATAVMACDILLNFLCFGFSKSK